MCDTCGCAVNHDDHHHKHDHDHMHHHHHDRDEVDMGRQSLLAVNDRLAAENRRLFREKGITVVNVVSSPGSGKTALLEQTMRRLKDNIRVAAVVGDLATDNDAARLNRSGASAIQINTGSACHLDAHMIHHAVEDFNLDELDLLLIENVGNLVCPASFDLGEDLFTVLLSTTEGEDKPLKYPVIFLKADAVIVNKCDIAEAVDFNRSQAVDNIAIAAPKALIFETSAKNGNGIDAWCDFIRKLVTAKKRIHV
ncbi:MAG TPA: hydrogenase nickel incorporation protein HypB [Kiritimatiellia bacterium]|nr:hydrogenase nickel incorporation protein HypB [Kiritimatiellia bacterium]